MADVARQEVEVLPTGLKADSAAHGPVAVNVWPNAGAWEVRAGFGQVAQFDAGMPNPDRMTAWGYMRHIGSRIIDTNFGHRQIVSLFMVFGNTSSVFRDEGSGSVGTWYEVSIYDTTTGRRWHEVLHRHTAEYEGRVKPMPTWRAVYNTNADLDVSTFISADGDDYGGFIIEYQDQLIFGNRRMGVWAYIPADFDISRSQDTRDQRLNDSCCPLGESALVLRVHPQDGLYPDAYAYLDAAGFPSPSDCTVIAGRLAMAAGRDVYFSDMGVPNAVMGLNILPVPCDGDITAIGEVNGVLMIWTSTQTWLYRPNVGSVVTSGDLRLVDPNIGCSGPFARVRVGSAIIWADKRGMYTSSGQYDIAPMTEDLHDLFESELSLPLTNYYQNNGFSDVGQDQPRTFIRWHPDDGLAMTFDPLQDMLVVSMPWAAAALIRVGGVWALWQFESVCNAINTEVARTANLPNPVVLARDGDVWLVSAPEGYTPNDQNTTPENIPAASLIIAKWRRGGGPDRTVRATEDRRRQAGYWWRDNGLPGSAGSAARVYVGDPTIMPSGWKAPRAGAGAASDVYLFPVHVSLDMGTSWSYDRLDIRFTFDKTLWVPLFFDASAELDYILPAERDPASAGWGWGAPTWSSGARPWHEVQCYDVGTGLPSQSGGQIRMHFDGSGGGWTTAPYAAISNNELAPVLWLPFVRNAATDSSRLVESFSMADYRVGTVNTFSATPYAFRRMTGWTQHDNDDVAQPVDWCVTSAPVGLDGRYQVRLRGLVLRVVSHAQSPTVFPSWPRGLLNASVSSDQRDWLSQIVDFTEGAEASISKVPFRTRVRNLSGEMVDKVFGDSVLSTGDLKWGSGGAPNDGNLLIDNEQLDTVAISDSIRGEHVSAMLFGHVRGRAERLVVDGMKVVLLPEGGRRRIGR